MLRRWRLPSTSRLFTICANDSTAIGDVIQTIMTDPLELEFIRICKLHGINFTQPELIKGGRGPHGSLDFHLTDYNLSVEVKAWSCERMVKQLDGKQGVMVLIGLGAVQAFGALLMRESICIQTIQPII